MSSAIELYDKLRTAPDDATRARIIAEVFDALEQGAFFSGFPKSMSAF